MKNPVSRQASTGFEQMSLLPEPDFNPTKPKPNTLPARCLSQMLRGQHFCPTRTISRYYLKPEAIQAVCGGAA